MASKNRDVNLRIRARDETGSGIRSAQSALERLAAVEKRRKARTAGKDAATQNVQDLRTAYDDAAAAAQRAGERIGNAARPSKKMRDELDATREAARRAKQEYLAAAKAAGQYRSSTQGGFARVDTSAIARGRQVAPTAPMASVSPVAAASAIGLVREFKSLRPDQVQNFGYQINDLITQIASGTSPMQAFAQQGGQIAQIFPQATGALLRMIPVIGLAALALSPFVAGMVKANNETRRLKDAESILRRSGDAATYSAPQLAAFAERLETIGIKADDAKAILTSFVRDAVDPTYLDGFAKSAKGLADALGIDVSAAAEKVASAFTGNADAVIALDDEINFLTESERKNIEALKASGKEAEARTQAFAIFEKRYDTISGKMRGPWRQSVDNLKNAFGAFADFVGSDELWANTKAELQAIANLIQRITASLPGARAKGMGALRTERDQLDAALAAKAGQPDRRGGPGMSRRELMERRFAVGAEIARQENDARRAALPRAADTTRDPDAPEPIRSSGGGARDRGASDAQRRLEAQREFVASLEAENAARQFGTQILSETERQQRVLTTLRTAELGAQAVGLELTDLQRAAIVDTVAGEYDRQQSIEAGRVIEEARLRLAEQRGELLSREARIERELASVRDKFGAAEIAVLTDILGAQIDLEDATRRRADADAKINDLLSLRSELIASLALAEESGDGSSVAELQARIAALNTDLIAAARNALALMTNLSGPAAEAARVALGNLITETQRFGQAGLTTAAEMNRALAQGGANAIDQFASSLAQGANAFGAMRDAFLSFAADFLRQIAFMIAQQALLNALGGGSGGGTGGSIAGFINGLFGSKHTGGLVGHGGGFMSVNPAVFSGATRYHSGGLVGLAPNEVPIIAKRNEEVLTESDPRHRANGGGGGGKAVTLRNVNVIDPGDMVARGLETESGEQSFFNFIGRNASAINARLA